MGIVNTVSEIFKESLKPKLDWRQNAGGVTSLFSKKRSAAAIAIDVDEQEFIHRYKNVRFSSWSAMFFMGISFISVPMAHSMLGLFTSLLSVTLFLMFYFRYAFLMWVCRDCWANGLDPELVVTKTIGSYLRSVVDNPTELMPLALPEKGTSR